jgi:hypothetical protein
MIEMNNDAIMAFLKDEGFSPQIQKETNQVYLIYERDQKQFPTFFRIYDGQDRLQIILFFPNPLPKSKLDSGDVARLLHALNKEIDYPGLGLDEDVRLVFHRFILPTQTRSVEPSQLQMIINALPKIVDELYPLVYDFMYGKETFDEWKKARQPKKK